MYFSINEALLVFSHLPLLSGINNSPVLLAILKPCSIFLTSSYLPSPYPHHHPYRVTSDLFHSYLNDFNNRTVFIASESIVYFKWKNIYKQENAIQNAAQDMRIWVLSAFSHHSITPHLLLNEMLILFYPWVFPFLDIGRNVTSSNTSLPPIIYSSSCHNLHQSSRNHENVSAFSYSSHNTWKKSPRHFLHFGILTLSMYTCNPVLDCKSLRTEILSPSIAPRIMQGTKMPLGLEVNGKTHQNLWEAEILSLSQIEDSLPHHILQWPWKSGDNPEKDHVIVGWQVGTAKVGLTRQGEEEVQNNCTRGNTYPESHPWNISFYTQPPLVIESLKCK